MDGMKRSEVDRAESYALASVKSYIRPRDAATLILLDRVGGELRVLMGRRHAKHAFMPGKFVFPGGRTEASDARIALSQPLDAGEIEKLTAGGARVSPSRARAIAMSAVREAYEETGLLVGRRAGFRTPVADWQGFVEHGVEPAPDRLRFIARAITPPGRVRRFDTRFFAAWRSDVAVELPDGGPTRELEEVVWLSIEKARETDIPAITRTILGELDRRLAGDPQLRPGAEVPFYRLVGDTFTRSLI
jgi:8-oxo-dGTP pyrophosphatase MutT (NUDIX family)